MLRVATFLLCVGSVPLRWLGTHLGSLTARRITGIALYDAIYERQQKWTTCSLSFRVFL